MSGDREQEALLAEARKFEDRYRTSCQASQTRYGPTLIGRLTDLYLAERALRVQAQQECDRLQHFVDCANTPLMAQVLRERESAKARVSELEQALTKIAGHESNHPYDAKAVARAALAGAETKEPK